MSVSAQIRSFARAVYILGQPVIGEKSDDLAELGATELYDLVKSTSPEWDDDGAFRVADLCESFGKKLKEKLAAADDAPAAV